MDYRTAHALISGRCVNDCLFCAVAAKRRNQLFPQKKEVIRFIRNVAEDGSQRMVFSGLGEPTLDPHFEEYLNVAAEMGFKSICLFTNGYGLDREKAEKWRAVGLTEIMLSIHGVQQTHDRDRRVASFQCPQGKARKKRRRANPRPGRAQGRVVRRSRPSFAYILGFGSFLDR